MDNAAFEKSPANWLAGIVFEQPFRIDALIGQAVSAFKARGLEVAGVTQTYSDTPGCSGSQLRLQSIDGAMDMPIMEPRGHFSKGCRLDYRAMADATAWIENTLDDEADLIVLNRFGRAESEGNGLRTILQRCAEEERPTLIAVRKDYVAAWNEFHGGLGDVLPANLDAIVDWYLRLPRQPNDEFAGRQNPSLL
ncbi:MAG: hypothetical protein APF80_13610 [Alphaproteobacteria bacterium BRH_c36]|nr:MAG: hypothetical protein APF80_13610 [Alphaproteobacteria bacterium BRH_c36]